MNYIVKYFIIFAIIKNNEAFSINSFKTSRLFPTTTYATNQENGSDNSELAKITETKQFLENNGYDVLNKDIEQTVKYSKFESFKAFSQNKAIQETIKYLVVLKF
jgi:hypothetical protein